MSDYPGFVNGTVLGVASCGKCNAVGTIVDMALCCKVRAWAALGPLWDVPDWRRLKRTTCKRPGRRRV